MNPFAILDIRAALNGDNIPQPQPQVVSHNSVHPDLLITDRVVRQNNADALLALLAFKEDLQILMSNAIIFFILPYRVTPKQLKLVHLSKGESHHGIIIIDCVLNNQTVGL